MLLLSRFLLLLIAVPSFCADWNPRLAATYLDARQESWRAWPYANQSGVPCISCHTGVPYLLARPLLRGALGEGVRTSYEKALMDGVRAKLSANTFALSLFRGENLSASDIRWIDGAQIVLAAFLLAVDDARENRGMSAATERAFERMWSQQLTNGDAQGAWNWSQFDLDPFETTDSPFYGAALAAVATGIAPGYQSRPAIRRNVAALSAYLHSHLVGQPLHNRLLLLWAGHALKGSVTPEERRSILDAVRREQGTDGGWSLDPLGPWKRHTGAPTSAGSNSYATAVVAFTLIQAGTPRSDGMVDKALSWLKAHQDTAGGYWDAQSMNAHYEANSMPVQFMRDAATAYAAAALAATTH